MSKTKHTPGPWKVVTGAETELVRSQDVEILGPEGALVAMIDRSHIIGYDKRDMMANATLIAAVHDLLEALDDMVDDYEKLAFPEDATFTSRDDPVVAQMRQRRISRARAAIAKAKGKSNE